MSDTCRTVSKMLLEEKDTSLYNSHISGCGNCRAEIARVGGLLKLLKTSVNMEKDLWERVESRALESDRNTGNAADQRRSFRPVLRWAAAAAAACLTAFLIFSGGNTGKSDRDLIVNELLNENYEFIVNDPSETDSGSSSGAQAETAVEDDLDLWEYNVFYEEKSS